MPQPVYDAAFLRTLSPALTSVAVAWLQSQQNFAASSVFPIVPVNVEAGSYKKYVKADWFRTDATVRAPGTETAGSGWTETYDTYQTLVQGVHKDIDGRMRANAVALGDNPDMKAARFVSNQLLLRRELDFVAKYMTTSVWGTDLTGVSGSPTAGQFRQWSDYTNGDPALDIASAKLVFEQLTGFPANVLVIGPAARMQVANHPKILSRIQYTQRAVVTNDILAALFEVDKLVVPKAVSNTANEGATAAMAYVWGKSALLAYAPPSPSTEEPSAGYTFTWQGYLGANNNQGTRVRNYRIEQLDVTRVEGEMAYDLKVVAPECGTFFASAVA